MAHQKKSGRATLRDGASLQYTLHGEGGPRQPRIALVHSLGMGEFVWDSVVERLVERALILTYDCRGHGASSKAAGPSAFRMETFANDLEDLLSHVGWDSAHVAGASLGGSVALQFAILNPGRAQTLGLIDTTAWYGAEAPQKWEWRAKEAEEKGLAALIDFQKTRWFSDHFREQNPAAVEKCCAAFVANDLASFAATCRMLGAFDLRQGLAGLRMPTAVIVGEEDFATPLEMARELEKNITGATLEVIPKARHLTFIERPDVIAEFLSRLIERVLTAA
jgi:3-oxoadipate enol-lactonase